MLVRYDEVCRSVCVGSGRAADDIVRYRYASLTILNEAYIHASKSPSWPMFLSSLPAGWLAGSQRPLMTPPVAGEPSYLSPLCRYLCVPHVTYSTELI